MFIPIIDYRLIRQFIAASIASISVIVMGTTLGWPSPVLPKLKETGIPMRLTNDEVSWMVSLLYLGNLASPIPSGIIIDKFGRRRSLLVLATLPLISWLMIIFASKPWMLYVARFLTGTWAGTVCTVIPMYLGEISEPRVRGALSTFFQIMINFGVVFEYIIGPRVSYNTLAILSGSIPVIFVITFWFMPESPYWELMTNQKESAAKSLAWLRACDNVSDVKEELENMSFSVQEEMKNKKTYKDLIATKGNRRALLTVQMLAFFQRTSGITALMAYTSTTLPKEGAGSLTPNDCVIVMGLVWLICVFIATFLVDTLGRKPLLLTSSIGCSLAMFLAGLWFYLDEETTVDVTNCYWVPFAAFILFGFCFSIGLGPIAFTMQGELFPTNIKGIASGITSVTLAVTSFITIKIYHDIANIAGMYFNYWLFFIFNVIATIFVAVCVIETKGKTLSEIQERLNKS